MNQLGDSTSPPSLDSALRSLIQHLKSQGLTQEDLLSMYHGKTELAIPLSVFAQHMGALEALTTYLREEKKLRFTEIGKYLNRDQRSIWVTYSKAKKKPHKFISSPNDPTIPLSLFHSKLTILESLVLYLRDEMGMDGKTISEAIKKSPSTIWTTYKRAKSK